MLLCQDAPATRIVYSGLAAEVEDLDVVVEEPVSRFSLARRRAKKLGWPSVLSQVLFTQVVVPLLRRGGASRIQDIINTHDLQGVPLPDDARHVPSVNSPVVAQMLGRLEPVLVIVFGTRIIGRHILQATSAPFVNVHFGITPMYRGVHGGYWALAEGRPDLVGTTIHLVDEGIDTGGVLEQVTFEVSEQDNFATYPYLHVAAGLPALKRVIASVLSEGALPSPREARVGEWSRLHYHPTVRQYMRARARGVR